ncbi:MAG: hypothetical protein CMJ65_05460, partial [Planctomycetaceae bacterium]|nr:hypothetical protein [Planctomycetaceae bacterium]
GKPSPRGGKKSGKKGGKKGGKKSGGGAQTGLGNMAQFDTDKDGKISKKEGSSGWLANIFDRLDADSDGFITAKEAAAARASFKRKGGGRPKGSGSGSQ